MAKNYTEAEVRERLAGADIVSTRIYELLPEIVRENDPAGSLKAFFGAVQEEYNRNKESIDEILMLIDPNGINNKFILSGSPTFLHPEQFVTSATGGTNSPPSIVFDGSPPGVSGNNFYNGFGLYVWDNAGNPAAIGQYRRVVSYVGATKTAFIDTPWFVAPGTNAVIALCWPDRIYIPSEIIADPRRGDGTTLPNQFGGTGPAGPFAPLNQTTDVRLPNLFYISNRDDYYNGWFIEFLDGENRGGRFEILSYVGDSVSTPYRATIKGTFFGDPAQDDWFKLIPPGDDTVSTTDNFYKDRWVRLVLGTADTTNNYVFRSQNRKIIRSEFDEKAVPSTHICYIADDVTGEGERWDFPPDPFNFFGITNHFVSLAYLARQVGFRLDALDPEELQREQIRQAYNFYKLKGTKRAIELISKTFGLEPQVVEQASNYTHAPDPIKVGSDPNPATGGILGPEACSPAHDQYPWKDVDTHIEAGRGEDEVPCSFNRAPDRDTARIPDSDIKLFLSRTNPNVFFDSTILERIVEKIEDVRPIHVEIILVGFLEVFRDKVEMDELLQFAGTFTYDEDFLVSEGFAGSPTGTVIVPLLTEAGLINETLTISAPARYDVIEDDRYDTAIPITQGVNFGLVRYDVGTVYHEGD